MQSDGIPAGADRYEVSVERGPATLIDGIAPEWRTLAAEGPCAEPFHDPAWVSAYVDGFGHGAPVTLLTVRRDGVLRGVLPLQERTLGVGPIGLRVLRSTANSHFPRFDAIHGVGDAGQVAGALWSCLRTRLRWDLLQFESTPDDGVVSRMLELAGEDGHATRRHRPDASPYIDLARYPAEIDAIISSLSANLRSQNRRALKKLRARGEVRFRIVGAGDPREEQMEAVQALYRLEASGWKGEAGTAILSDPVTEEFYTRIAEHSIDRGSLAVAQLWCNDDLVISKFNLVQGGVMYELKSGYDESYRDCSPGHLVKAWEIVAGKEQGLSTIDNCGRSDPHKVSWTPLARPFSTAFIGNRTPRGRLAWNLLFVLGPRVRERLARVPLPAALARVLG